MINLSFVALCQNPEELDRLRADPGLIPAAVEELLRYVIQLQEAFSGLAKRLPGLRMAVPMSGLEFREGQAITSVRELPVTWDDA